jgi:hypothetical protein
VLVKQTWVPLLDFGLGLKLSVETHRWNKPVPSFGQAVRKLKDEAPNDETRDYFDYSPAGAVCSKTRIRG